MKDLSKEDLPKPILIEALGRMFPTEKSKWKKRYGLYKCGFCGTNFKANTYDINRGYIKNCGCYKKRRASETNKTHGLGATRLYAVWGDIKSCGCYMKRRSSETHKTHGLRYTRLYSIWSKLKGRVLNPKNKNYIDYGGRGITICDEWLDVQNFYNWAMSNGYSDELSIDRIDNAGNYCPENCRWTTKTIQRRNTRIAKNNTSGYKGVSFVKKKQISISLIYV